MKKKGQKITYFIHFKIYTSNTNSMYFFLFLIIKNSIIKAYTRYITKQKLQN